MYKKVCTGKVDFFTIWSLFVCFSLSSRCRHLLALHYLVFLSDLTISISKRASLLALAKSKH